MSKSVHLLLLVALCAGTLLLVGIYVGSEHYFYFWDHGAYHGMAADVVEQFRHSPLAAAWRVTISVANEYSLWYAIPLLPGMLIFGASRLSFIAGVALLYQVPYALVLGSVAARMIPGFRQGIVVWVTAALYLLLPAAWGPTLRGFPDVAAALAFLIAVLLYLKDPDLERIWASVAIGGLAALSILLRRHFAYDALALLVVVFAHTVGAGFRKRMVGERAPVARSFVAHLIRPARVAAVFGLTLLLLGLPFVLRVLRTDYQSLYASYTSPPLTMAGLYAAYYGVGILIAMAAGYALILAQPGAHHTAVRTVVAIGAVITAQWVWLVRQSATHYTLHFTWFIALGLAALVFGLVRVSNAAGRVAVLAVVVSFLFYNALMGLSSLQASSLPPALFSRPFPPQVRSDYDEVAQLVGELRRRAAGDRSIYVAASSTILNEDLLRKADLALYGEPGMTVLSVPQIDSRDSYPLEMLLAADLVVTAEPFQYSLRDPGEQRVVSAVLTAFNEGWPAAQDFRKLPQTFDLMDGVRVTLYKRLRPTSATTAAQTFFQMKAFIGRLPGRQPPWLVLRHDGSLTRLRNGAYGFQSGPQVEVSPDPDYQLLYAGDLVGQAAVSIRILSYAPTCRTILVILAAVDEFGTPVSQVEHRWSQDDPSVFSIKIDDTDVGVKGLLLAVAAPNRNGGFCSGEVTIEVSHR